MKNLGIGQLVLALALSITGLSPSMSANGQTDLLVNDYPSSYLVQENDSLWNIASQFLQNPERWPEIWQPDEYLDNAELIYPGDRLKLSVLGGTPRIFVQRGDRNVARITPQVREEQLQSALPAIPSKAIATSFTKNRIISQATYDAAPYIVSNIGDNLVIGTGDVIFVRGTFLTGANSFEIYRLGRTYLGDGINRNRVFGLLGTTDEEVPGLEVEYLGFASIIENLASDIRKMLVNNSSKGIRVGDRLLIREASNIGATIFPTEPAARLSGQIVAFLGAETLASQLDTVVIDLGLEDSLAVGDILSIQQASTQMTDAVETERMSLGERMHTIFSRDSLTMPGNDIGTLLVYKIFEKLSYAVILSSTQPVELHHEVVSP